MVFSRSMCKVLKEHLDSYLRAIKDEETGDFWVWFMDMWVRLFPKTVTNRWAKEYKASIQECYQVHDHLTLILLTNCLS